MQNRLVSSGRSPLAALPRGRPVRLPCHLAAAPGAHHSAVYTTSFSGLRPAVCAGAGAWAWDQRRRDVTQRDVGKRYGRTFRAIHPSTGESSPPVPISVPQFGRVLVSTRRWYPFTPSTLSPPSPWRPLLACICSSPQPRIPDGLGLCHFSSPRKAWPRPSALNGLGGGKLGREQGRMAVPGARTRREKERGARKRAPRRKEMPGPQEVHAMPATTYTETSSRHGGYTTIPPILPTPRRGWLL